MPESSMSGRNPLLNGISPGLVLRSTVPVIQRKPNSMKLCFGVPESWLKATAGTTRSANIAITMDRFVIFIAPLLLAGEIVPGWVIRPVNPGVEVGATPVQHPIVESSGSPVAGGRQYARVSRRSMLSVVMALLAE